MHKKWIHIQNRHYLRRMGGRAGGRSIDRSDGRTEQLICRIDVRNIFKQNHLTFDCMQYREWPDNGRHHQQPTITTKIVKGEQKNKQQTE